jgi:diguanylate cyclase (GGDEF)-like protein
MVVKNERAEVLRKKAEAMNIDFENRSIKSTFSAGVATFPTHSNSSEIVLSLADKALYQSKANGRNRVTAYRIEKV